MMRHVYPPLPVQISNPVWLQRGQEECQVIERSRRDLSREGGEGGGLTEREPAGRHQTCLSPG